MIKDKKNPLNVFTLIKVYLLKPVLRQTDASTSQSASKLLVLNAFYFLFAVYEDTIAVVELIYASSLNYCNLLI